MPPKDVPGPMNGPPKIACEACQSALGPERSQDVSFLLLDHLTVPVLSCEDHLEAFAGVCALSTDDSVDLLDHLPAGGIQCPACRKARYNVSQAMIPIEDGVLAPLACPEHLVEIADRFKIGLETQASLTTSLDSVDGS